MTEYFLKKKIVFFMIFKLQLIEIFAINLSKQICVFRDFFLIRIGGFVIFSTENLGF